MSTGYYNGDGSQASHWKDNNLTGVLIGAMDPTLALGQLITLSDADYRLLDLIGWDISGTPDTTAPTVSSVDPIDGATDVAIATTITVTFSEPVDAATVNNQTFTVTFVDIDNLAAPVTGIIAVAPGGGSATFIVDPAPLSNSTQYTVTITSGVTDLSGNALDQDPLTSGNQSFISSFTTAAPDLTAPAAPTGLIATAGDSQVNLNWADSPESDLAGYNLYRSTTPGSGYVQVNTALITSSDFVDLGLTNATTYYYIVTAVDTSVNESGNSNEVSATPAESVLVNMHVADITMSAATKGRSGKVSATAVVTVIDANGQPVAGATVFGSWSGATTADQSAVSGVDGTVSFSSGNVNGEGTFTFTVDNIEAVDYTYDAASNIETADSVTMTTSNLRAMASVWQTPSANRLPTLTLVPVSDDIGLDDDAPDAIASLSFVHPFK